MKLVPRYTDIADNFAIEDQPSSVAAPQLLLWNEALAQLFNIDVEPALRETVLERTGLAHVLPVLVDAFAIMMC